MVPVNDVIVPSVPVILTVDKLDQPIDSVYEFPQILLVRNDEDIFIGNPIVPGASVTGKITGKGKGKKITVAKFKAKVRYRRKMGFRPLQTTLVINRIEVSTAAKSLRKAK